MTTHDKRMQLLDENGREVPWPEDGVIRDGHRGRVRMTMMDAAPGVGQRLFAVDGSPAGYRPGYCYDAPPEAIAADHAAVDHAHAAHEKYLADAWRGDRPRPPAPPTDRDAAEALYVTRMHLALRGAA